MRLTKNLTVLGADTYGDSDIADFYDGLEYAGTYLLAFRDLPDIVARLVTGKSALDFACGCGRSTRFLKSLGFDTIGVDISQAMLTNALRHDPEGEYLLVGDADLSCLSGRSFDLILSAFPLASATTSIEIQAILTELRNLLAPNGRLIVIEPTEALYLHEWVSFSMAAFPENANAKSGDPVPAYYRDHMVQPVIDILWKDEDYRRNFEAVGLQPLEIHRPLAHDDDPGPWISERQIPPWVVYVLSVSGAVGGSKVAD